MNASFLRLTLLGLGLSSALAVQTLRADDAAPTTPPPGPPPHGMHHDMLPPGFDKLNLTDDQKAKIKEIFKQTRDEMKQKIDAVLTDDQKAQLEKMKADHKGGPGGPGGGTPPPPPAGQ